MVKHVPEETAAQRERGAERAERDAEAGGHDEHVVQRLVQCDQPRLVEHAVARRVAHCRREREREMQILRTRTERGAAQRQWHLHAPFASACVASRMPRHLRTFSEPISEQRSVNSEQ